jgi:hypothetical protein
MMVTITPQSMRQAVAQSERELPRFCDNCLTEDACNVRGMCAHTLREQEAQRGPKVPARGWMGDRGTAGPFGPHD